MADFDSIIGQSGLIRFGGIVDEEWHRNLKGQSGAKVYREMSDNDANIGGALLAITSLIKQTPWHVREADGSAQSADAAEFLESVMGDMSNTWSDMLDEILTMLPYGWAYMEKVYKVRGGRDAKSSRRSRYDDGMIGIRRIALRAQTTLDSWEFDEDGGIKGMWQSAAPLYQRVYIPIEKAVLFRVVASKNNPEGRSFLRNGFRDWFMAKRLEEIEAVGMERDLVGLPIVRVPQEMLKESAPDALKALVASLAKMASNVRRNEHEGVVFPSRTDRDGKPTGFDFELLSSGGQRALDIGGAITRHKQDMLISMLMQFLRLGSDGVGSFSLADTHTSLFTTALGNLLNIIEGTFNRFVVDEVMQLNGIKEEFAPKWVHGDIEKPNLIEMSTYLKTLMDGGALTPDMSLEKYIRDTAGLPPMDEGDDDLAIRSEQANPVVEEDTPDAVDSLEGE